MNNPFAHADWKISQAVQWGVKLLMLAGHGWIKYGFHEVIFVGMV